MQRKIHPSSGGSPGAKQDKTRTIRKFGEKARVHAGLIAGVVILSATLALVCLKRQSILQGPYVINRPNAEQVVEFKDLSPEAKEQFLKQLTEAVMEAVERLEQEREQERAAFHRRHDTSATPLIGGHR